MRPYRSRLEAAHQAFIFFTSLAGVAWIVSEITWIHAWRLILYVVGLALVILHFSPVWDQYFDGEEEHGDKLPD